MKQIEKIKKIYLKQKLKEVNCLIVLEFLMINLYIIERQGITAQKKKKDSRLVRGRKKKKREKFRVMSWTYILYIILRYKSTIITLLPCINYSPNYYINILI
jgi:hypothetical protein